MLRIPRCVLLSAALVAGLVCAGAASAQLRDEADLFKNPERINQAIKDIETKFRKTVLIETSASVPAGDVARVKAIERDKDALSRYFSDLAKSNARRSRVDGLYIFVNKSPHWLEIVANNKTDAVFPVEKRRELRQKITPEFKQGKFDEGILSGLTYIRDQFSRTLPGRANAAPGNAVVKHVPEVARTPKGEVNWAGIICFGLLALVVIWLVIGLIRAFTAPRGGYGGGGPGYAGGPGYGGGYGGGGGGFMTGLFGGLFGAVAGNWLYHNMFGGGGHSTSWGSQAYGGDASTNAAPDDYTSTGGSWDDNAGGDQGGGGGDAGGDWGGGGGDAGGGGGDFGGGGGGDWGGGGGDFGGGGGGGDW